MAKKTIPELDDGTALQEAGAEVAFSQNGATFRGRIRPNPTQQINVINQAQLETAFGVNLEIPDFTNVTIVVDGEFDLTTSIKLGDFSGLDMKFSTIGPAINWTGSGAMIVNLNPANPANFLIMDSVNISGDMANSFIDLVVNDFGFLALRSLNVDMLGSIGTIESPVVFIASLTGFVLTQGLTLINCARITFDNVVFGNFAGDNTTWFTFISDAASIVKANDVTATNPVAAGDSLFFIDPNSLTTSSFVITSSAITDNAGAGEFYQSGVDIAIDSVANNGGNAEFTTASAHGLVVGTPVVNSGFGTEITYNGTFIVTAVPSTTQFVVDEAFTFDDTGNMNESSLDETDIIVRATDNTASPDSKNIGSVVVSGNSTATTIDMVDEFTNFNLGGLAVAGSNIQRWIVTNTTTGEIQYIGKEDFNGVLNAAIVIEPNGTQIFDIRMIVNGSPTADAVSSRTGISGTGISTPVVTMPFNSPLSVVTGDLVRLQILNEDGTDNPTITDMSIGAQNP